MSVDDLSPSAQNYLKVLWGLQEWSDAPITPTLLANKTGLKLSSVSEGIRRLADQGLVDHEPYGAIRLTDDGSQYALTMVRRHRLIETFLVRTLGYRWDEVHDEAEQLEHAVSDLMVERIDELLGHPTKDPHGDPIPDAAGGIHVPDASLLTDCADGERVRVERISDSDPQLLQYFAHHSVLIGAELTVTAGPPYSDSLTLTNPDSGQQVTLGRHATDAVWVTRIS